MSGSRPSPAEQHLGDRLAALIDGELGHDARERVLAHLATCPKCKAEADAQRRLKSVFAEAAPPSPTESFLARLQGLPAGGDGPPPAGGFGEPVFPRHPDPFGYAPTDGHGLLPPAERGFRIHHVGRTEAERAASRGRRFAFAAAGAVSLAAIALGGVSAGTTGSGGGEVRGAGSNVTGQGAANTASAAQTDGTRRRADATAEPGARQDRTGQDTGALAAPADSAHSGQALTPLLAGAQPTAGAQEAVGPLLTPLVAAPSLAPFLRTTGAVRPGVLAPLLATPAESGGALTEAGPSPSSSGSPLR